MSLRDWLLPRMDPGVVTAALDGGYLPPVVSSSGVVTPYASQDHLVNITLGDVFPVDVSALPVGRAMAMTVPAVAKIRQVACGTAMRLPLVAFAGQSRMASQPPVVVMPEAGRPASVTWQWVVDSLIFYGRAWLVVRERAATAPYLPTVVEWCREDRVQEDPPAHPGEVTVDGVVVRPGDLIRVDGPHEGFLVFGAKTVREALDLELAAANVARNPVPAMELHQTSGQTLGKDQIDALIDRWSAARRSKSGAVGYTSPEIETKVHGQPAEQLLVASRDQQALSIARLLGAPAWVVDAAVKGSSLTYSNVPSRSRELIDYFLSPYLVAIQDRLSMDDVLPAGQWCRFDTSGLLQGDFRQRMESYEIAIRAGVYTAEQCRAMESGLPLEDSSE